MKTKYESFLNLHIFVDHLVANLQYTDSEGQTIMHVVVREWCTDLTLFLLHYGAEIDVPDKYGRTPLFVAAAVNYKEMVRWLLDYGGKFCVFSHPALVIDFITDQVTSTLQSISAFCISAFFSFD